MTDYIYIYTERYIYDIKTTLILYKERESFSCREVEQTREVLYERRIEG